MIQKNNPGALKRSMGWTGGIYALTAFHHYYGSVIYATPWREHVVFLGGGTLLLCFLLTWLYRRYQRRWLLHTYLLIAMLVFGLGIGLFEGFYNHAIKNILYFSGMNMRNWRYLYPAPAYEVPDNFVFESTGVMQFVVGVGQLYWLYKVYKANK